MYPKLYIFNVYNWTCLGDRYTPVKPSSPKVPEMNPLPLKVFFYCLAFLSLLCKECLTEDLLSLCIFKYKMQCC